jgi:nickel and cobalt resistance protein CnrR
MSPMARTAALIIVLTLLGAMLGGWAGVRYALHEARPPQQLDQLLHQRLHLSSEQEQQLSTLEAGFAQRRREYETQMRTANQDIGRAITVRHRYDPEAQAAIDRLHRAMMELQDVTVQHVLAMRALLTPDQMQQFDRTVDQALAVSPP